MSRRAPLVTAEPPPSPSRNVRMALGYAALLLFTIFALYPICRVVTIAFHPNDQFLSASLALVPRGATLANFRTLLFEKSFLRWLGNSTLIALAVTVTGVALASTAGYALSRLRFAGRSTTLRRLIVTQMFPATILPLPLYLILIKLGLIISYLGIVIIFTATALPFCVWQLKGCYDTIPLSLEEACAIDGATRWQAFYFVILPLAAPAVAITALFSFLAAWNEYIVAALVLPGVDFFTLPSGLKMFQSNLSAQWGLYAAGALLVSLPVVALFLVLSRCLDSGLSSGAVKDYNK